jgi:hypothetical protein
MSETRYRFGFLAATAALFVGCLPDPTTPTMDAAVAVTYTKDVQPILKAKCAPCHVDGHLGNHDIATNYADVSKPVESVDSQGCWNDTDPNMHTMPKKVGECALVLINSGKMPLEAGCGSAMPLNPEMCLSAEQKATIAAWVAGGMPQ